MLDIEKMGLPLITTHPPPDHLRPAHRPRAPRRNWRRKLTLRRWYGFLRMQGKVARQARRILTRPESSKRDIVTDFGVDPARIQVIPLGVDDVFRPADQAAGRRAGSWRWPAPTPR